MLLRQELGSHCRRCRFGLMCMVGYTLRDMQCTPWLPRLPREGPLEPRAQALAGREAPLSPAWVAVAMPVPPFLVQV